MYGSLDFSYLSRELSYSLGREIKIDKVQAIGGGSISHTFKLISASEVFFLKTNSNSNAKVMFQAEVEGLELLRIKSKFSIPKPIGLFEKGNNTYLIMKYIESATQSKTYWDDLAITLADLHKNGSTYFGFLHNNFIGSLPQQNTFEPDWCSFFTNQRIQPMIKRAYNANLLGKQELAKMESILYKITDLMPVEPPALIHGDLWSGNLMVSSQGDPCLIDPAVYYGHREMDISFTHMFGGFNSIFYNVYQEVYPLQPGFSERIDLYNLYPLLVHLNLFGRGYFAEINTIINRFR